MQIVASKKDRGFFSIGYKNQRKYENIFRETVATNQDPNHKSYLRPWLYGEAVLCLHR